MANVASPTVTPARPTSDNTGTLVDNGDGTYQYTFYRDITKTKAFLDAYKKRFNFASWIVDEVKAGHPIRIVTDQIGSPTLADDLAGHEMAPGS